jgi:hypothetical protein
MTSRKRSVRVLVAIVAFALLAAACDSSSDTTTVPDGSTTTTTTPGTTPTSTTEAPLTSIPIDQIPGGHSSSISDELDAAMRTEIGSLMLVAEENRALPFLEIPTVTILDEEEFTARVVEVVASELDPVEIAGDELFLKLMGMLDGDVDYAQLIIDVSAGNVIGFYDPDVGELVIPVAPDGLSEYQKITVVHELVHALTDQHFDFADQRDVLDETGNGDDGSAVLAGVEGDATYQQFVYFEGLDPSSAMEAALETLSFDSAVFDAAPTWVQQDLMFPYEQGFVFIGQIVADGGLKGVDEMYEDLPTTTEQILEPRKYLRREEPDPIAPVSVSLDGWTVHDDAAFGEWGVRLILADTLSPGRITQAASGWGNDSYRVLLNGDDVAVAWRYVAESIQDAEDLVNALILHARGPMGATSSVESGGGLILEGGGTYVFIDRMDDQFVFIASTDAAAGAELRTQMGV